MKRLSTLLPFAFILICSAARAQNMPYYKLTPVPSSCVTLTDNLWKTRAAIAFGPALDWVTLNFDRDNGGYRTFRESQRRDTVNVAPVTSFESIKVLEAAGEYLKYTDDPDLEAYMDRCIDHWVTFQDKSGYFRGICLGDTNPKGRWNDLRWGHELYGVGHLLEAALSYYEATGKKKILDAALRSLAEVDAMFGRGKRRDVPGHQEIERALTRYYEATGEERWLELARFFIDERGHHDLRESYGTYAQDHIPFVEQRRVEGHAVRGAYLYIGATDIVGATGDREYEEALNAIWENLTQRHMYNTGASGVIHSHVEGYAEDYNIPPDDTYGETCAAMANSIWAHRLNRLHADASYMDAFEKIVYNAFLSSMADSGQGIYYCNHVNHHAPEQRFWPQCPCCPGNLLAHFARMPGYVYSTSEEGIYVNLYVNSDARIGFGEGVEIEQETAYPWDGKIILKIDPASPQRFALMLRVPGWAGRHSISVNGKKAEAQTVKGYAVLDRQWTAGDRVEFLLPMQAEREYMSPEYTGYDGLVAVRRGPLVYTFEGIDNYGSVCNLQLPSGAALNSVRTGKLGGIVKVEAKGRVLDWDGQWKTRTLTAIPCGMHSNRGTSVHYVWIAEAQERVQPPVFHLNSLYLPPTQ